jgi:hypothetical protein
MGSSSSNNHPIRWVPVNFEKAEIRPGEKAGYFTLEVTGLAPGFSPHDCQIKLEPEVHASQPEYWKIKVLWNCSDAVIESPCPFKASLMLDGIPGTKGVEVVGETRSIKIARQLSYPSRTAC